MCFGNKKCRIYAAFGVSQTPKKKYVLKGERKMSSIPSTAGLIPGTVVFYKSKGLAEKATVLEPKKEIAVLLICSGKLVCATPEEIAIA